MIRRWYWLYWFVTVPIYWLCALCLLTWVAPVLFDGGGPTPSFFWSHNLPHPNLMEYEQSFKIRMQYQIPYWIAASILTLLGCCVTTCLAKWKLPKHPRLLPSSFAAQLLFLVAAVICDVATSHRAWMGPLFFGSLNNLFVLLKVTIPMSLLAGILQDARRRVAS